MAENMDAVVERIEHNGMLDDGTYWLEKHFKGAENVFTVFPEFKAHMRRALQRGFSPYNKEVKKLMPKNKYWLFQDGHWVSNYSSKYTSDMKAQDEDYFKRRQRNGKKQGRLFYHYTTNKKSIKQRTKIWVNEPTRGKLQGQLAVRWRSTAPHYHLLRYGRAKYGEVHDYVNEEAEKWMSYWESSVAEAPSKVITMQFISNAVNDFQQQLTGVINKGVFDAMVEDVIG